MHALSPNRKCQRFGTDQLTAQGQLQCSRLRLRATAVACARPLVILLAVRRLHSPLTFSRLMRSMWMTHFLRYTCVTLPSRPCSTDSSNASGEPTQHSLSPLLDPTQRQLGAHSRTTPDTSKGPTQSPQPREPLLYHVPCPTQRGTGAAVRANTCKQQTAPLPPHLECAAHHLHLVILPDGHRAHLQHATTRHSKS